MAAPMTTDAARALRALWFDYLDTIAPIRPQLHAYCHRLTGSIWDADDLIQDTLVRGFGAIGRSDMNNFSDRAERQWFDKPQAYLSQIATNLWIDRQRRRQRETLRADIDGAVSAPPTVLSPAAGEALYARTAPQERAAIVLKDAFDFSIDEIAAMLATTPGAVKAALHRGRGKLAKTSEQVPIRNGAASPELIDRFLAAFIAHDVPAVVALLLDSVTWEVQGVGGERGTKTIWLEVAMREGIVAAREEVDGERIAAFTNILEGRRILTGVIRFEESAGKISRLINYGFCDETLALVGAALGLDAWRPRYHQDRETMARMIRGAGLPWADRHAET